MDSGHPDVEKTEYMSCNHLATAHFVTAYSDNQDLSREHQQPFNYTMPISLHVERHALHVPQVLSNPADMAYSDKDLSREHRQHFNHTRPISLHVERHALHVPQVPSNPADMAYSDKDLSREHRQHFNHTRPISLHVETHELHVPQVPSNPTVAHSGNDYLSREHQQIASHTGPVCLNDGRQELHMPQVPSNPTSHSGNMDLSRRYQLPLNHTRAFPIHGGSHEQHQTYVPQSDSREAYSDNVDNGREYQESPIPLHVVRGQMHQELWPSYTPEYHTNEANDTTLRSNISGLQSYAEYGSVMSSYPQCTTCNSEDSAQETSEHDWQYYGRGATPYYSSHTRIQSPLISGFMLFPSPANSLPRIESFRGQSSSTVSITSTNNLKPTSSVDQNKAEYQNWLVSEGTPFASHYYSNQTGAEYIFNGTTIGSILRSKPDLPMNQTDSQPANIPIISSVYSVQERYSLSATHDNIKTGWSQYQPPPDTNNAEQLNGNSHPDVISELPSQNTSFAAHSSAADTHQHQIVVVKEEVCRTSPEQQEVKRRKSTHTIEHNKLPNETSEVASSRQRLSSALQSKTVSELRRFCWNQGLKIAGRKQVLVERILDPTQSSKSNDQTRLRTIHLWLKRSGATGLHSISRCLCSAIDKGFLNMMDLSLADVIAKGECPHCSAYMEATIGIILHQPDNPFQCVADLLKCPNCRSITYVTRMCLGAPVFTTPEKHNHCIQKSMFGGCVETSTN